MPIAPIVGRDGRTTALRSFLEPAGRVDWQIIEQWAVGTTVLNERLDRFEIGSGWLELPVAGVSKVNDAGLISLWRDDVDLDTYTAS